MLTNSCSHLSTRAAVSLQVFDELWPGSVSNSNQCCAAICQPITNRRWKSTISSGNIGLFSSFYFVPRLLPPPACGPEVDFSPPFWQKSQFVNCTWRRKEWGERRLAGGAVNKVHRCFKAATTLKEVWHTAEIYKTMVWAPLSFLFINC